MRCKPRAARMGRSARWALVGLALSALLMLTLHVVRPDLDWRVRFMSEYAFGWSRPLMVLVFLTTSASTLLVAWTLVRHLRPSPIALPAAALLCVWSAALVGLAMFPGGQAHDDVLRGGRSAFAMGVFLVLLHTLRMRSSWPFALFTLAMGALAAVPHVHVHILGLSDAAGLAQRAAGLAMLSWMAAAAWWLGMREGP